MTDPVRILAFDTSGPHLAVALTEGRRTLVERTETLARGQAEALLPRLEAALAEAGMGWSTLDALAVGIGPGNFTGIRISVAAARGLALGLAIPAVGVSTLEAAVFARHLPAVAAVAAPRGRFYAQVARPSGAEPPAWIDADALNDLSAAMPICSYDADAIAAADLDHRLRRPAWPLPVALARIAAGRLVSGDAPPRPAPLYIKAADAAPARDAPPILIDDA